ncbi:error-prone DNA polymerase [Ditylenchus destructor]|nr:error-prone DNA polymerase [Ditylenchus destructor]
MTMLAAGGAGQHQRRISWRCRWRRGRGDRLRLRLAGPDAAAPSAGVAAAAAARARLDERERAQRGAQRTAVRGCGIVTVKQQPATAKGTIFISLEDETGDIQVIVHRDLWAKQRQVMLHARLMGVRGRWQRSGAVRNLVAGHLEDLTPMLGRLRTESRDFSLSGLRLNAHVQRGPGRLPQYGELLNRLPVKGHEHDAACEPALAGDRPVREVTAEIE